MESKKLLIATGNRHKIEEITALLGSGWELIGLEALGFPVEIPETEETLEGNALLKARFLHNRLGQAVCAEDTGLEISALSGRPGVKSARYAGDSKDSSANMALVLAQMEGIPDRSARFRTVIAFIDQDGTSYTFEGICEGTIRERPAGSGGFGYDPVFEPQGYDKTFAELPMEEKNRVSHRALALRKFIDFLQNSDISKQD